MMSSLLQRLKDIWTEDSCYGLGMFERLPLEVFSDVLTYLDFYSICRLSCVNSIFNRICNDDSLWKSIKLHHFNYCKWPIEPSPSQKETCKRIILSERHFLLQPSPIKIPFSTKMKHILRKNGSKYRIIFAGLDDSGKTTILYRIKLGKCVDTIPTNGFNIEDVTFGQIHFEFYDIGGSDKIRPLYRHYYPATNGLIFVIDSSNLERLQSAKIELQFILKGLQEFPPVPVLIFANKQDHSDVLSVEDLRCQLLKEINFFNVKWHAEGSVALTGEGINEGLQWLSTALLS